MKQRPNFKESLKSFKEFLKEQGWPTQTKWLNRETISGYKNKFWIFKPESLDEGSEAEKYYEQIIESETSVRVDAFWKTEDYTICYIMNWGGSGEHLNFGVPKNERTEVIFINSKLRWLLIKLLNKFRSKPPKLKEITQDRTRK